MVVSAVARAVETPAAFGRWPLERMANEFGVDWGDLVLLAHSVRAGAVLNMPADRKAVIRAAADRVRITLGDATSRVLFDRIKAHVLAGNPS